MRYGLLILLVAILFVYAPAQTRKGKLLADYTFRNLNNNTGLISNEILSIAQDHRGFIWLGTFSGMQRYDGVRFVSYPDPTLKYGENPAVENIYTDKENNSVWFVTDYRFVRFYNWQTNSFYIRTAIEEKRKTTSQSYIDDKGKEWLLNKMPFLSKTSATSREEWYTITEPGLEPYIVIAIADSLHKQKWIYGSHHWRLLLFDDSAKKIYTEDDMAVNNPLLSFMKTTAFSYRKLFIDSKGIIWVYSWEDAFIRYNPANASLKKYSVSEIIKKQGNKQVEYGYINKMMEDDHHIIWIGTANAGLLRYEEEIDDFSYILKSEGKSTGLQYNYEVRSLSQDKEGNIWVGTDKGISVFNPYHDNFIVIRHKANDPQSLPNNELSTMLETSNGDLMIGTWGGGITILDSNLQFKKKIEFPTSPAYQKNMIWSFCDNKDGYIWAGAQHGYLHKIESKTGKVETTRPAELQNSTILIIKKDRDGNKWFALENGKIIEWNEQEKKFYPFNNSKIDTPISAIHDILIDHSNRWWVTTWNGIREFDPVNRKYIAYYRPDQYSDQKIHSLHCTEVEELNDSLLVIGTYYGGLQYFNKNQQKFTAIPIDEQHSSYSAYALQKDAEGNIWFTSDYDLYRFSPPSNKIVACNPEKELLNSSFRFSRFYVGANKRWFVFNLTELLAFYPNKLKFHRENESPVTISGFKISDAPFFVDSFIQQSKPVRLNYKQNFFTIEFATLDFLGTTPSKYMYQLSPVDEKWVNAGTRSFANYTSLAPGKYIFSVKREGNESGNNITSFAITIDPPWWQTWWFRSALLFTLLMSAWFIVLRRIRFIRNQAELKHKISETEMAALRAQMNPHFIFNCLNAIDNLIQTDQKGKATTYLNRFAKLIRYVLDSSKNNLVPFDKDYTTLKLFLELEQFRCDNKFQYKLNADPEIMNSDIKVPPLIIQPFVENAIHHGLMNKENGDRLLSIDIKLEKEYIHYTITDNGIGRQKAAELKSINRPEHVAYGIEMTKHRVDLHNQNGHEPSICIEDLKDSQKPVGTKVDLLLAI